jgi:hypothetical protein
MLGRLLDGINLHFSSLFDRALKLVQQKTKLSHYWKHGGTLMTTTSEDKSKKPKKPKHGFTITTKEEIKFWIWLSRLHQLSLELRTSLKMSAPILHIMFLEGWIDKDLRGTRKNKALVYQAMIEQMKKNNPAWELSDYHSRLLFQLKQEGYIE